MKKIKSLMLTLLIAGIIGGLFAFTPVKNASKSVELVSYIKTSSGYTQTDITNPPCNNGTFLCGFRYDAATMTFDQARTIAEANFATTAHGGTVQGVQIFKRSTQP